MPDDFKEPLACVWRDNVDVDLEETEAEAPPFEPEKEKKLTWKKEAICYQSSDDLDLQIKIVIGRSLFDLIGDHFLPFF